MIKDERSNSPLKEDFLHFIVESPTILSIGHVKENTGRWRCLTVKTKPRFGEYYSCFGCETKKGGCACFVYFSR